MKPDPVELNQAFKADIPMIIDMRMQFADELAGSQSTDIQNTAREHLHEYFSTELNKTCLCWYATEKVTPVSIVTMVLRRQPGNLRNPTGKWGYLMNVYTIPSFRRLGISSMLLDKIIEHASDLGYTAFELHSTKDGEPLYTRSGFTIHPEPTYRRFL